jgi:hypothetical protein
MFSTYRRIFKMSKYRSQFEQMVHLALGKDWDFEPYQMDYSVPRKYTPDFVREHVLIECKGYFREGDTQKYRAIKEQCHEDGLTFVFCLMNPHKKVRKGSHLTMAGWCEKNSIPWFDLESVDEFKEIYHVDS